MIEDVVVIVAWLVVLPAAAPLPPSDADDA